MALPLLFKLPDCPVAFASEDLPGWSWVFIAGAAIAAVFGFTGISSGANLDEERGEIEG